MFTRIHRATFGLLLSVAACAPARSPQPADNTPAGDSSPTAGFGWRAVESTSCGFRVRMPAPATESVSHDDSDDVPTTTWDLVAETRGGSGAAAAGCTRRDDGAELLVTKELLGEMQDEALRGMKARAVEQRAIVVAGHAAGETRFTSPSGDGALRVVVVGDAAYVLVAIGLGPSASKRFLESFALVGGDHGGRPTVPAAKAP